MTDEELEREKQLMELVRLDYDTALRSMSGFITTAGQLRGFGITAWSVVLGLAVRDASVALSILAAFVLLTFWYADAYHSALYRLALSRALELEKLLAAYVDRLGIDADDEHAVAVMVSRLESHRFGMHRWLRPVTAKDMLRSRPKAVFRVIYPALLLSALGVLLASAT